MAGLPAVRRRYVVYINGDPKWPKMAEDRIAVHEDKGFIVHAESLAEAYANFESEFGVIFRTFSPAGIDAGMSARAART